MICSTIRKESECVFMTANGCTYNGGICHEIVEQCDGCNRKTEFSAKWYCSSCPEPSIKWKIGNCNLASHVSEVSTEKKAKVNPLKASKRNSH